jgi:hypothetical protein
MTMSRGPLNLLAMLWILSSVGCTVYNCECSCQKPNGEIYTPAPVNYCTATEFLAALSSNPCDPGDEKLSCGCVDTQEECENPGPVRSLKPIPDAHVPAAPKASAPAPSKPDRKPDSPRR